jgi:hypothetical protein
MDEHPARTDKSQELAHGDQSPKALAGPGPTGIAASTTEVATGTVQQATPKSPNDDKSPWWTDARKVLVTQVVVLILTPVFVAVTVYVTEATKAPKPRIEYVSSSPLYPVVEPDRSFAKRINSNPDLAWRFRQELRNASLGTANPIAAVSWLDGRAWDSDYADTYRHVTNQIIGTIQLAIKHPASEQLAKLLPQPDPKDFPAMLAIMEAFAKELTDLDVKSKKAPRSGNVQIRVGILNAGASDGTVFDKALLTFRGQQIHVHMPRYVPVKSHGFEDVVFETPGIEGGKLTGQWTAGEEEAVKSFITLITQGQELPFEITITLSDKTASAKAAVSKEEK